VEVNEGGECYTASDVINIPSCEIVSGIEDLISDAITVYPNPTYGKCFVSLGNTLPGEVRVEVIDALGTVVSNYRIDNAVEFSLDLSSAPVGIYFCKMYYKDSVVVKKIVKQ